MDLLNTENFKRGTVELVILKILAESDMYGYEIVKAIEEKSCGKYELCLGSLYPILYRFVENGYLTETHEIVNKRMRRYYHLEEKGKEFYKELLAEYQKISDGIKLILEGGDNK